MKIFTQHIRIYLSFCVWVVFLLLSIYASWDIRIVHDSENISEERTVLLFDVSRSMNIRDMTWNQSRLNITKSLIESYISQTNNQIWLSIFAWEWVNILPINSNHELTVTTLKWLDSQSLQLQWSRLDMWVRSSISLFWDTPWGNLIIFTDQDSYEGKDFLRDLQSMWDILKNLNISTTLVWVGTTEWWTLEIWRDFWWEPEYLTYRWEIVRAPLEEDFLREISRTLWGNYINYQEFHTWNTSTSWNISQLRGISTVIFLLIVSLIFFVITLRLLHKISYIKIKNIFS